LGWWWELKPEVGEQWSGCFQSKIRLTKMKFIACFWCIV